MKKILFACLCISITFFAQAQYTLDYLRAADNYYRKGDYYSAAQYYEKYLGTAKEGEMSGAYRPYVIMASSRKSSTTPVSNRQQAVYYAAESYRELRFYEKAAPFYGEAISFDKISFPLAKYWYATTQRALGNYAEAEKAFREFSDEYTARDEYSDAASREIANLGYIRQQLNKKDIHLYQITKAGIAGVDTGAVYAPVWLNNNTLVFTSTRQDEEGSGKKEHLNRLYEATASAEGFSDLHKLPLTQTADLHQGVAAVSADGNTLYFTRWTILNDKKSSGIYVSHRNADGWSAPDALSTINRDGFHVQQPCLSADGKILYYSSDQPGGLGGFDLWYAPLDEKGNPSAPVNLTALNTRFDEQAPYYHAPSGTMVFASNGRVGMGNYDLFYAKGVPGKFEEPQNFGYPVNSIKDDIYFASRGNKKNILEDALISTDRAAACCLQLFSVKKLQPLRQVKGLVVSCETHAPLAGVVLNIVDPVANKTVYSKTTDATGQYDFTIEEYLPLKAMAVLPGYHPGSLQFATPADEEALVLQNPEICLAKIPVVGTVEVLENVYFEFNKAVVLDESEAALNKLVNLLNQNPEMEIELSGHTDSKGNDAYNRKLSEERARSVVDYLVSKGIDRNRLKAKGYGESKPVAPNTNPDGSDNPEGREKNRRTEFKVLKN